MRLITCPWRAQSCQHQRLCSSSSIKDSDIVCQKIHHSTFQWKPTFGLADWGGGSGVGETLSPCCQRWTCVRAGSWVRGCAGQYLASSQKNKKTNKNKTALLRPQTWWWSCASSLTTSALFWGNTFVWVSRRSMSPERLKYVTWAIRSIPAETFPVPVFCESDL